MADALDSKSIGGVAQGLGRKGLTKNAAGDGTRVGQTLGQNDPDLAVAAWLDAMPASISAPIRAGIVAMVKATKSEGKP